MPGVGTHLFSRNDVHSIPRSIISVRLARDSARTHLHETVRDGAWSQGSSDRYPAGEKSATSS